MIIDQSKIRFLSDNVKSGRPPSHSGSRKKNAINRQNLDVRFLDGIGVLVAINGFLQKGLPEGHQVCCENESIRIASDDEIKDSWLINFLE